MEKARKVAQSKVGMAAEEESVELELSGGVLLARFGVVVLCLFLVNFSFA